MTIMKTTIVSLVLTMAATVSADVIRFHFGHTLAKWNVVMYSVADGRGNDNRFRLRRVEGRESRDWRQVHV